MLASEKYSLKNDSSVLDRPIYQAYSYSYPHKTAYRAFEKPISLKDIWLREKNDALFLYVHIPFCEMRCGFCNLFTLVRPDSDMPDLYLDALERQISSVRSALRGGQFARYAIGGGTPTYLSAKQLDRLFSLTNFGLIDSTPIAIESSPETITADKVQVLQAHGVSRISMGVQSYTASETKTLARRQENSVVRTAIDVIRKYSDADLNLDLIYGIAGQTSESWLNSLRQALLANPEELYLYPLYVREKTGLSEVERRQHIATDLPEVDYLELYRLGRDFLLSEGYQQISMRMFRRVSKSARDAPIYSCQDDGMLGLGAGARSYTRSLHYSSEYAVGRHKIKDIISHYIEQNREQFTQAHYGICLDLQEQKRRFVIQSILLAEGLDGEAYKARFNTNAVDDFTQLKTLVDLDLAKHNGKQVVLTSTGIERADSIGPWLASETIRNRMQDYKIV